MGLAEDELYALVEAKSQGNSCIAVSMHPHYGSSGRNRPKPIKQGGAAGALTLTRLDVSVQARQIVGAERLCAADCLAVSATSIGGAARSACRKTQGQKTQEGQRNACSQT